MRFLLKTKHTAEFLKMNPNHGIPTITDGDFHLFEAAAIMQYIANKYQLRKCMVLLM